MARKIADKVNTFSKNRPLGSHGSRRGLEHLRKWARRRVCANNEACGFAALPFRQPFKTHVLALASSTSGWREAAIHIAFFFDAEECVDRKTLFPTTMKVVQPQARVWVFCVWGEIHVGNLIQTKAEFSCVVLVMDKEGWVIDTIRFEPLVSPFSPPLTQKLVPSPPHLLPKLTLSFFFFAPEQNFFGEGEGRRNQTFFLGGRKGAPETGKRGSTSKSGCGVLGFRVKGQ